MKYDPRRVLSVFLDELAQVFRLSPEVVERCRRQAFEWLRPRWPVLFLATGDQPPSAAAIESFRSLTALGIEASLVRSHSFSQVWSTQQARAHLGAVTLLGDLGTEEIGRLPDSFALLCVLTLSDNTVVKTVLGLRDAVPSCLLRAFLERGRPVVAAGLPPPRLSLDESAGFFWQLPLPVRQWLFDGYRVLEQWGVEFVEPERLAEAVRRTALGRLSAAAKSATTVTQPAAVASPSSGRAVITVEDVRSARGRGERQMAIPPNTTVTDEAREFAQRWAILLLE